MMKKELVNSSLRTLESDLEWELERVILAMKDEEEYFVSDK